MFRYMAFAWEGNGDSAFAAARLFRQIQQSTAWQTALLRDGLGVFTAGTADGVNGAYQLNGDGVVVGKLFRRDGRSGGACASATLSVDEARAIVDSDGHGLIKDYWGRYIAFICAKSGAQVLRDPSGTLPCYTTLHAGVTIVFSWLEDVAATMPGTAAASVNWSALAAHILLGELGGRITCLAEVAQILPGQVVRLRDGRSRLLWNAVDFAQDVEEPAPAIAADVLSDSVRSCSRSWASCYAELLLRLSGGLDSSIVLSCLAPSETSAHVACLNYHSTGADSDERLYARLAAATFNCQLVERLRETDFRLDRILHAARMVNPVNHLARMGTSRMDAEVAAAHGAQALFTGGGGDQLFFESHRWWPAADYLRLRGADTGFPAVAMAAARLGKVSVWHALRMAAAERIHPSDPWRDIGTYQKLTVASALPARDDLAQFSHPAQSDLGALPIGKQMQVRQVMHPVGYYEPFERSAAPELVNPLLSQPLVELCLRWPTYLLAHGGRGRGLVRQAFAGVLPPEIAWRRSKGGMEEHIKGILFTHRDFARELLLDGQLVKRGMLDRDKLEKALSPNPTAQQSHTAEIHVYLGIEAWLARSASP